jgi:hypothetical protein
MTTEQYLILAGVGLYFGIGAFIAYGITALSMGFTGKFEPMAIAIFFGWPVFYALRFAGPSVMLLPWLACAGAIVGVTYLLLTRS